MPSVLLSLVLSCAQPPCGREVPTSLGQGAGQGGNVLIVVVDDVGVEQLDRWGLAPVGSRTPTLDCLCDRGLRFTQAWASPACSPTRAEYLTGHYNRRLGVGTIFTSGPRDLELSTRFDALPEVAARAGYATGFFGKWHLAQPESPDATSHPHRTGFDRFAGSLTNLYETSHGQTGEHGYHHWERVVDGVAADTDTYPTTATVDDALAFVDEVGDQPWLVVLSFHAPHVPLHWPPARLRSTPKPGIPEDHQKYLAMLEAADTELGRFLRSLGDQERADTHIVWLSDNGTPGRSIPEPLPPAGKATVTELGVRVPLVVASPAVRAPGVSDALVHVVDILPTVAELLGVEHEAIDGRSWSQVLADPTATVHETVATSRYFPLGEGPPATIDKAIRTASHKLIVHSEDGESLHAVSPDTLVEGPDLLAGPLTDEELAQLEQLRGALDALDASVAEGW